jgi:WD40 repeat protein
MNEHRCPLEWSNITTFGHQDKEGKYMSGVAAASPDGFLFGVGEEGSVCIADATNIMVDRELKDDVKSIGHVTAIKFFPDGRHVIICSTGNDSIWDVERCKPVARLHDFISGQVDLFPDGRHIVTSGRDLIIRDAFSDEPPIQIINDVGGVGDVVIAPNGHRLAFDSLRGIHVFDVNPDFTLVERGYFFNCLPELEIEESQSDYDKYADAREGLDAWMDGRAALAISPDGRLLASVTMLVDYIDALRVWNIETGEIVLEILRGGGHFPSMKAYHPDFNIKAIFNLCFLADSKHLAIQYGGSSSNPETEIIALKEGGVYIQCCKMLDTKLCWVSSDGAIIVTSRNGHYDVSRVMIGNSQLVSG